MSTLRATAVLLGLLLLAGCSRTALDAPCPNGYRLDETLAKCVCSTDEGCPTGMSCEQGTCVCRDTSCCPAGYEYSTDAESCVCRASECCPKDHLWLPDENKCVCGAQNCCPDGYAFNDATKACECAGDACCPLGHVFDTLTSLCRCAADSCCPVDYVYDPLSKDCVCAKTACCPANHAYEPSLAACVCVGDNCCPPLYRKDGNRCVCIDDASCTLGQFCDNVGPNASGGCRCRTAANCPPMNFCNSLGFCQSFASCTSNLDCPTGTFCDITTDKCIPNGPCTIDEHCAFNSICSPLTLACTPGCRSDGDCDGKNSCVNGVCTFFCRDNTFCPVNQFCDKTTGRCATHAGRVDCNSCGTVSTCGSDLVARCLTFITEGQTNSFCGMVCHTDDDCPSGFDCGGVIFGCSNGAVCEPVSGDTITCKGYAVENETGTQYYCADSTGNPHEYFKACAPRSGFCPAVAAP